MKIREIRFKNLNSLYGEWRIDLARPEYQADGIFAITGPTGAGKSTILDAICLALYGTTPRLGRITKSGNEIMSRQTGDCLAEVVFESQAGVFRCTWSQHRARRRADGNLAEANHEIADAISGKILESKKTAVLAMIEEKTGMDIERFSRSIMLSQGRFAAFLQASPDERAPILEQITGTEIYSEISRRVHERQRDERNALNNLEAEAKGVTILDEAAETALREQLTGRQAAEQAARGHNQGLLAAIAWRQEITQLQQELAGLAARQSRLNEDLERFQPARQRLAVARRAADLDGAYAALATLRGQQEQDSSAIEQLNAQWPVAGAALAARTAELAKVQEQLETARQTQQIQLPIVNEARNLDRQIAEKRQAMAESTQKLSQLQAQLVRHQAEQHQQDAARRQSLAELEKLAAYFTGQAADGILVDQMTGITAHLSQLLGLANDIGRKTKAAETAQIRKQDLEKALDQARLAHEQQEAGFQAIQARITMDRKALADHLNGRLLREYRQDLESLRREQLLQQKIVRLESERKALSDGQPCPLCGSLTHPYAQGNIPELDETAQRILRLNAFIEQAEQLDEQARETEKQTENARRRLEDVVRQLDLAGQNLAFADAERNRLATETDELRQQYSTRKQEILAELQPLGIREIPANNIRDIDTQLKERKQRWEAQQASQRQQEKICQDCEFALHSLETRIAINAESSRAEQAVQAWLEQERLELGNQRRTLFGEQDPQTFEQQLSKAISTAQAVEQQARQAYDASQNQLQQLKARREQLQAALDQRMPLLAAREHDFTLSLEQAGFADEAAFLAGRLPAAERKQLSDQAGELDTAQIELSSQLQERSSRLAQVEARQLTALPLAQLKEDAVRLEQQLQQLAREIGALERQLADNARARADWRLKLQRIEEQKATWQRWSSLNELIGSSDGKKYRNYAQGITFEILVAQANRQLEKMSDRYLLIRDTVTPLELNVADNYQAGEIRSTKNLSGGESFIVSLALALGLSKMASRKVRVDSLFLDEGFGTLDEETLETALDTLSGLQQDGKLIGVISHVSALKDRIRTQINVSPQSAGRSVITGPGVSCIARPGQ